MQMTEIIRKVGPVDVKVIRRDSFLLFMFAFAVIIAVVLRNLLPWANDALAANGIFAERRFSQCVNYLLSHDSRLYDPLHRFVAGGDHLWLYAAG